MSIPLELNRRTKTGRVCSPDYRKGPSCPLIVRETSEDVLTGNVFGILRRLRPSLWLKPLLQHAFEKEDFTRLTTNKVKVNFWHPVSPPSIRASMEGNTEVDVLIQFDDTLIFIEAKYRSGLSKRTKYDQHRNQLVRLLDVAYSYTIGEQLYKREPYVLVLGLPNSELSLVTHYRNPRHLENALKHYKRCSDRKQMALLLSKRVGYCSWSMLADLLNESIPKSREMEQGFLADVRDYIGHKVSIASLPVDDCTQMGLPLVSWFDGKR